MPMPLFSLQPRSQAHPAPFRFVQLAVAIAVEALQQAGVFTLPFADHLLSGGRQVQPLTAASRRAEITDGVKRFVGVQTLFAVAISTANAEQPAQTAQRHTAWVAQGTAPYSAEGRSYLGAARVDEAFAGGVGQAQPAIADAPLHHTPAAALAVRAIFLDAIAPPQAGLTAQGSDQRHIAERPQNADQLHIPLGRRANPGGRGILQMAYARPAADADPAAPERQRGTADQDDQQPQIHVSRTGSSGRRRPFPPR